MTQKEYNKIFTHFVKACQDGIISFHLNKSGKIHFTCTTKKPCTTCEYSQTCGYSGERYEGRLIGNLFAEDLYEQYPELFI